MALTQKQMEEEDGGEEDEFQYEILVNAFSLLSSQLVVQEINTAHSPT